MAIESSCKTISPIKKHTLGTGRLKLYNAIGDKNAYLLSGNPKETITLVIPDLENGTITIAVDTPAITDKLLHFFDSEESYTEISISASAFRNLIDIIAKKSGLKLVPATNKGGRKPKYSAEDAKRIASLHKDGMSIRCIAEVEKMSPNTVQKLIREYESMAILESMSSG